MLGEKKNHITMCICFPKFFFIIQTSRDLSVFAWKIVYPEAPTHYSRRHLLSHALF